VSAHIETLRDRIEELEKQVVEYRYRNCELSSKLKGIELANELLDICDEDMVPAEGVKVLVGAVKEMMAWGVELDDERLKYIAVQVYRRDIEVVEAALEALEMKE
jgi:hypothetical protein